MQIITFYSIKKCFGFYGFEQHVESNKGLRHVFSKSVLFAYSNSDLRYHKPMERYGISNSGLPPYDPMVC